MKKISISIAMMAFFTLAIAFTSCKSKVSDADVKTAVETALKADPMAVNTMVSVEKGVATISGECKDDACKTHCADLVKGINSFWVMCFLFCVGSATVFVKRCTKLNKVLEH